MKFALLLSSGLVGMAFCVGWLGNLDYLREADVAKNFFGGEQVLLCFQEPIIFEACPQTGTVGNCNNIPCVEVEPNHWDCPAGKTESTILNAWNKYCPLADGWGTDECLTNWAPCEIKHSCGNCTTIGGVLVCQAVGLPINGPFKAQKIITGDPCYGGP
jgi:hypothetical protein